MYRKRIGSSSAICIALWRAAGVSPPVLAFPSIERVKENEYKNLEPAGLHPPLASEHHVDRYWLLTWTTYGTWLPGDERGFVGSVKVGDSRAIHNQPGTDYDRKLRGLTQFAERNQKAAAVRLTRQQAATVANQIRSTATFRQWKIGAFAVMANHVHVVVGVPGDPAPSTLLRDFKSFCSRELNRTEGATKRWWTQSGSTRKLPDESAVIAAIRYVRNQSHPLAIWVSGFDGEQV
jgi:REP element-mobilizing transposase RayT